MFLTLYIPGLFGPGRPFSDAYVPRPETMEFLLSRGTHRETGRVSYHRAVSALFGHAAQGGRDIPVAAISRLLDSDEPPSGCWMRADPVHLAPDRQGLVLIDAASFELNVRDALALAADIRPALRDAGCELEVPFPDRWYLHTKGIPGICTRELESVAGRDIQNALPAGSDAGRWHRLLNEIQMLLHGSEVNREREARGLPAVNSLWIWGVGELPQPTVAPWSSVWTDELFARGLARLSAVPVNAVPDGPGKIAEIALTGGRILVILDHCARAARYQDLEQWNAAVVRLEDAWFQPGLRLLRTGAFSRLDVVTDGWCFAVSRTDLFKFWRRKTPFNRFVLA